MCWGSQRFANRLSLEFARGEKPLMRIWSPDTRHARLAMVFLFFGGQNALLCFDKEEIKQKLDHQLSRARARCCDRSVRIERVPAFWLTFALLWQLFQEDFDTCAGYQCSEMADSRGRWTVLVAYRWCWHNVWLVEKFIKND